RIDRSVSGRILSGSHEDDPAMVFTSRTFHLAGGVDVSQNLIEVEPRVAEPTTNHIDRPRPFDMLLVEALPMSGFVPHEGGHHQRRSIEGRIEPTPIGDIKIIVVAGEDQSMLP